MIKTLKNTVFNLTIILFAMACSFSSREVFDLSYQDRKIIQTLQTGPFYSIKENGEYSTENYSVWDFNTDDMEVEIADYQNSTQQNSDVYSFEIIEDLDFTQGVLRLYGSGNFNEQYLGVIASTNAQGAFLKLSIQKTKEDILKNTDNILGWKYVSKPILFMLNNVYPDDKIVSLDQDGFFSPQSYEYYIPKASTRSDYTYILEHFSVKNGVETQLKTIYLLDTTVFPPNREYTKVSINGEIQYMGVEFINDKAKTSIKIFFGDDVPAVKQKLDNSSYNFDIIANAQLSNAPLRSLLGRQMIFLNKTGAEKPYQGIYFWDNTDELIFNTTDMKLRVITTRSLIPPYQSIGVTNILDYNVKMEEVINSKSGIFKLTGVGKYQDKYGYISVYNPPIGAPSDAVYADFDVADTIDDAKSQLDLLASNQKYEYQDINTAIKSYRLIETLDEIGSVWVKLREDATGSMSYDKRDTEIFEFLNIKARTLRYTLIQGSVNVSSFYKVNVIQDINTTNGVVQLIGYTDNTFAQKDPTAVMNGKFLAIDRGSELYKTQAKYAIGNSLAEAVSKRDKQQLFNLHDKGTLPSDFKIITYLESFGTWVGLLYTGSTTPGEVPNNVDPNTKPIYDKFNTYEFLFNTAISPILTVTDKTSGARSTSTPRTYALDTEVEISPDYGIFKLVQQLSGGTGPNLDGLYMGVKVKKGIEGDKAYIVFNNQLDQIESEMQKIFDRSLYNYHAQDSAPLKASAIETISGIPYMQSSLLNNVPNGEFIPYATQIYTFNYNPLLLKVETITPSGTSPQIAEYALTTTDDSGEYTGTFQALGENLPLHRRYFRLDIQQGSNKKHRIRMLTSAIKDNLTDESLAEDGKTIGNTSSFSTAETTHQDITTIIFPEPSVEALKAISPSWASVDSTDKMYDKNNNTNITFSTDENNNKIITIAIHDNGTILDAPQYTYSMMSNNITGESYTGVVRLIGSGAQRGQYLAFTTATPTIPPNNGIVSSKGTKFAWGRSLNEAMNGLKNPTLDSFAIPTDFIQSDDNVRQAFENLGTSGSRPPGYGTPAFVWLKNNIYDNRDTETWTFSSLTNVTIDHNRANSGVTETYAIHFLEASELVNTGTSFERESILIYLKSKNTSAPYRNKFVNIRNHKMIQKAGDDDSESIFKVTIETDKIAALAADTEIKMQMRDIRSANIPARAFNLAKNTTEKWTRLHSTYYQKDKNNFEEWEFGYNNEFKIRVTDHAGTASIYQITAREDTSTHRGVFLLTSENTSAPYHNKMIAIGIGGEHSPEGTTPPYNFGTAFDSRSMRLAVADIADGDLVGATVVAKNNLANLPEWNFRVKEDAELPFDPIISTAAIVTENTTISLWSQLKLNSNDEYKWDPESSFNFQLKPIESIENIDKSQIYQVEISRLGTSGFQKGIYGMKLISTSRGGLRAEFQLFLRNDSTLPSAVQLSNKFIVMELGTGLNETLMKLAVGDTLAEAKVNFNALGGRYNWTTQDRAVSDHGNKMGVLNNISTGGIWSLARNNSTDTSSLGSALSTDAAGYVTLNDDYSNKPSYNPANTIDISFDLNNRILYVDNKNLDAGMDLKLPYGMTIVKTSHLYGSIFLLDGFGEFKDYFMYIGIRPNFDNDSINEGRSAVLLLARSLTEIYTMSESIGLNNSSSPKKRNLFQSEWIKVSDYVIRKAVARQDDNIDAITDPRGAFVELGHNVDSKPNVYDPLVHKSYTFIPDGETINGVTYQEKTVIISNKSPDLTRDDIYQYELSEVHNPENLDDLKSIVLLRGSGPDGDKYLGIRIPRNDNSTEAAITIGTEAEVKTALSWTTAIVAPSENNTQPGYNLYRYRVLSSVFSSSTVLAQLAAKDTLVTLDQDGIYLDIDTSEWRFDNVNYSTTFNIRRINENSRNGAAKVLPIKVAGENENQGILYLKESSIEALNDKYIGVKISGNNIKFYIKNTIEEAMTVFTDSMINNLVLKSTVFFGDEQNFVDVEIAGGSRGFGTLHNGAGNFTYNPNDTQTFLYDTARRLGVFIRVVNASTAYTNYVRLKYFGGETDSETKGKRFAYQFISNTRTDLKFRNNDSWASVPTGTAGGNTPFGPTSTGGPVNSIYVNWYFAIGNPGDSTTDGLYFGLGTSTLSEAINNRELGRDPKIIPMSILENNPRVLTSLRDELGVDNDTVWYMPVDQSSTITSSGSLETPEDYAFRIKDRTPSSTPPVYDIRFNLVASDGTLTTSKKSFLTKILADNSPNNGSVVLHGLSGESVLSNKTMAILKGVDSFETRVKVAYADSAKAATEAVNSLEFWNYRLKSVLDASTALITNLANAGHLVYYTTGQATKPSYNEANTTDWVFTETADNEVLTVYNIVNNVTNTATYGIQMIKSETEHKGIFQVEGFGPYSGQFIAVDFNNTTKQAKVGLGNTIANAITARDAFTSDNMFAKINIINIGKALTKLLGFGEKTFGHKQYIENASFYMTRNTYSEKFYLNSLNLPMVDITTVVNGVSRVDAYEMFLIKEGTSENYDTAVYRLIGSGKPEHDKILLIRILSSAESNAEFEILVGGRDRKFAGGTSSGVHSNDPDTLLSSVGNATEARPSVQDTDVLNDDFTVLDKMGTIGDLVTLKSGILETNKLEIFNANGATRILRVTTNFTTYQYEMVIVDQRATDGVNSATSVVVRLIPIAERDKISQYENKFYAFEVLDDYRVIAGVADSSDNAWNHLTTRKNNASNLPFNYWNLEAVTSANIESRILSELIEAASVKTIYNTSDDTIYGNLSSQDYSGLIFYADPRIFKNTGDGVKPGLASGTGTSRVAINTTKGMQAHGGYFDTNDYYVFDDNGTGINTIRIIKIFGETKVTNIYHTKVLRSESPTKGVIQLLRGTTSTGDILTERGNPEINNMFENNVLAIDLGSRGKGTDNIQIGYAVPESPSKIHMEAAINAAIADRDARLGDQRKYIPNMVPQAMVQEQLRALKAINNKVIKTFVNASGREILTPEFVANNKQMVFKTAVSNDVINGRNLIAPIGIKNTSILNGQQSQISTFEQSTDFLIRPIKTSGAANLVFKFYRPNSSGTTVIDDAWTRIIQEPYWAIRAGTGAQFFQSKMTTANDPNIALENLNTIPFYNQSYMWVVQDQQYDTMNKWGQYAFSDTQQAIWVQKNETLEDQTILGKLLDPTADMLNWEFFQNKGIHYVTIKEGKASGQTASFTYRIIPKDLPNTLATKFYGTFALDGIGSLQDYFVYFNRDNSNHQAKLKLHKTQDGTKYQELINFSTGSGSYSNSNFNIKMYLKSSITTGWQPYTTP